MTDRVTQPPSGARGASSAARTAALALGNLLLGTSLGLLAYSGLTDLATRLEQGRLRDTPYLSAAQPRTVAATGPATLDFEGWEEQDAAYWRTLPEGGVFGRLVSAPMGLDAVVIKGTRRSDLAKGPGWIDYTDLPGPTGNAGISGHRTTFGAPFRDLDRVRPGDTIDLYSPFRRYRYEVTGQLVVTPDRTEVVSSTPEPLLTLTACHPPYSARYRLIVHAKLTGVSRLEAAETP